MISDQFGGNEVKRKKRIKSIINAQIGKSIFFQFLQNLGEGGVCSRSCAFLNAVCVSVCISDKKHVYITGSHLRGSWKQGWIQDGASTLGGGYQHMILPNFPKNCMQLRKCWVIGVNPRSIPP